METNLQNPFFFCMCVRLGGRLVCGHDVYSIFDVIIARYKRKLLSSSLCCIHRFHPFCTHWGERERRRVCVTQAYSAFRVYIYICIYLYIEVALSNEPRYMWKHETLNMDVVPQFVLNFEWFVLRILNFFTIEYNNDPQQAKIQNGKNNFNAHI